MSLPITRTPKATSHSDTSQGQLRAECQDLKRPQIFRFPLTRVFASLAVSLACISTNYGRDSSSAEPSSPSSDKKARAGAAVNTGNTHCPSGRPLVALTFDDGPHPVLTPRLLDILKQSEIKATFYVIGALVQKYPEIVRRMVREGHSVGNHTWTHRDLRKLGDTEIRKEMQRTEEAILKATGRNSFSMRPPYGGFNARVGTAIPSKHHPVVMWSVDPQDWKKPGRANITKRLVEGAHPGAILLCHDIHEETISAIPSTLDQLAAKGYKLVTVEEILTKRSTLDLDYEP